MRLKREKNSLFYIPNQTPSVLLESEREKLGYSEKEIEAIVVK